MKAVHFVVAYEKSFSVEWPGLLSKLKRKPQASGYICIRYGPMGAEGWGCWHSELFLAEQLF